MRTAFISEYKDKCSDCSYRLCWFGTMLVIGSCFSWYSIALKKKHDQIKTILIKESIELGGPVHYYHDKGTQWHADRHGAGDTVESYTSISTESRKGETLG